MAETWRDLFHRAVALRDPGHLREALVAGMRADGYVFERSPSGYRFNPLLYAVDHVGGAAVVEALLAAGAKVDAPVRHGDSAGTTALGLAARKGDLPVVRVLLAAGADPNAANSADVTPLGYATGDRKPAHESVVKALLAAGAKSNYQTLVGAARTGSPAMIEMLAASGAALDEVSRWGTALVLAAQSKRADTTEALLRAGADPHLRLPADHRNFAKRTFEQVRAFDPIDEFGVKNVSRK